MCNFNEVPLSERIPIYKIIKRINNKEYTKDDIDYYNKFRLKYIKCNNFPAFRFNSIRKTKKTWNSQSLRQNLNKLRN